MINITATDFIIAILFVSFCTSLIVSILVYCLLKKKHDEDVEWLFNMIYTDKIEVNRFYNKYADHIAEYHKEEEKIVFESKQPHKSTTPLNNYSFEVGV